MRVSHDCLKAAAACLALLLATVAWAIARAPWWARGHTLLTVAAIRALPEELPAFFRAQAARIGELAQDPDVAKNASTPHLRVQETPEHFLDVELLAGRPLPADRYAHIALCAKLDLDPASVGLLPYALAEWVERLAVAFAEHRQWPEDETTRLKCVVYAGFVAHYAEDVCMPLHVTKHHDGRVGEDGKSPLSGIHARVDSLIERCGFTAADLAEHQDIRAEPDLFASIVHEIDASRALIDATYALAADLPPAAGDAAWVPSDRVRAFARERAREATRFTAMMLVMAWQQSATIELPQWLHRNAKSGG